MSVAAPSSVPWRKPAGKAVIRFSCPRCSHKLAVPENQGGSKFACPICQQRLQAPLPPPNKTILGSMDPIPPPMPRVAAASAASAPPIPTPSAPEPPARRPEALAGTNKSIPSTAAPVPPAERRRDEGAALAPALFASTPVAPRPSPVGRSTSRTAYADSFWLKLLSWFRR